MSPKTSLKNLRGSPRNIMMLWDVPLIGRAARGLEAARWTVRGRYLLAGSVPEKVN